MQNTPNYNLNKPDGNDYAKIQFLNENADIIDGELKRISTAIGNGSTGNDILSRLDTLEKRVGNLNNLETTQKANLVAAINEVRKSAINAWQKGVYNNTDVTNLGFMSASKVFRFDEWDDDNSKLDSMYINIPVGNAFSGLVKLTLSGNYFTGNSMGGAEIVYNVAKVNDTVFLNTITINHISSDFAKCFYVKPLVSMSDRMYIPVTKAPMTRNPISIKVEIFSSYSIFDAVNNITLARDSSISQPHPWTPQASQIPTYDAIGRWDDVTRRYSAKSFYMSDINQCINNGEYFINEPYSANMPYKAYWYVTVIAHTDLHLVQTARNVLTGEVYERQTFGSGWNGWAETTPRKLFQSVSEGKADNRAALAQKGVQIPQDPTFAQISQGIMQIKTGRLDSILVTIPAIPANGTHTVTVATDFYPWNAMLNLDGVVLRNGAVVGNNWANRFSVSNIRIVFQSSGLWYVHFDLRGGMTGTSGPQDNLIFLAPKMD